METPVPTIIKEILGSVGITYTDLKEETVAGQPVYQIISDDSSLLIGLHGETIRAIDHLVKKVAEQRGMERPNFVVDVNEYQIKRIRDLEMKAKMMAERARSFQYDVELAPMSAYERLIVHSVLADERSIKTESQGEGRDRRIVIKYSPEPETI
jgi:spoIIIJ-associated protein